MTKFQYMVLTVASIGAVLLLIIFGILTKMSFSQNKIKKKMSPCPDYWEEVKNVNVVNVYPNKEFVYKNNTPFTNETNSEIIGDNNVQDVKIMINEKRPLLRILNETSRTITACKVPSHNGKNVGKIYENTSPYSLKLRNLRFGNNSSVRNNYTTIDKIPQTGTSVNLSYDKNKNYYSISEGDPALITSGDNISSNDVIKTPGLYWKTECINKDDIKCYNENNNNDIKIWGIDNYTPSDFYIDFTHNDWHSINMNKTKLCNLKDWAMRNSIVWDGVSNVVC